MTLLLNFVLVGLLAGMAAAAAVDLVAIRRPRLAAVSDNLMFPLIALTPLLATGGPFRIALEHRRLDSLSAIVCLGVAATLLMREVANHRRAVVERRSWRLASTRSRTTAGVDSIYVVSGAAPATHGILRQAIVIPHEYVEPGVLRHEVEHYRFRDAATHAARRAVLAIFWFHPGLYLLDRSTRLSAELAADAAAIASSDEAGRQSFAQALLTAARAEAAGPAFGFRKSGDLELRIRTILGSTRRGRAFLLCALLLVSLGLMQLAPHFVAGDSVIVRRVIRIR